MSTISAKMPAVMTAPKPLTLMRGIGEGRDVMSNLVVQPLHQALDEADMLPQRGQRQGDQFVHLRVNRVRCVEASWTKRAVASGSSKCLRPRREITSASASWDMAVSSATVNSVNNATLVAPRTLEKALTRFQSLP